MQRGRSQGIKRTGNIDFTLISGSLPFWFVQVDFLSKHNHSSDACTEKHFADFTDLLAFQSSEYGGSFCKQTIVDAWRQLLYLCAICCTLSASPFQQRPFAQQKYISLQSSLKIFQIDISCRMNNLPIPKLLIIQPFLALNHGLWSSIGEEGWPSPLMMRESSEPQVATTAVESVSTCLQVLQ